MIRITFALGVLLFTAIAHADPAATRQEAKRLRDEGVEAMRQSDFAHAVECFQRAYDLYPSPNLRFNIAVGLDKLGRVPEAVDALEEFLEATAQVQDEAHRFAGARLAELAPRVARLELTIEPKDASVQVDGERVRWPRTGGVPVAPGERRVSAARHGWTSAETVVTATLDAPVAATLRLTPLPPAPPVPAVMAARLAPPARRPLYRRWWVWTAASAATVAVALGVGLGVGLPSSSFHATLPPLP
jgi:hypothetical protein